MKDEDLQVENGNFTRIVNPLIEHLIKIPFRGCELALALLLIRQTYGYHKTEDSISLSQICDKLKRGRPTVVKALKNLILLNIVVKTVKPHSTNTLAINKYFDTWRVVNTVKLVKTRVWGGKHGLTKTGKDGLTNKRKKETNTKENTASQAPPTFNLEEYLKKMEENPRQEIQLIAYFFRRRGLIFTNLKQIQIAIRRHLRAAQDVIPFEKSRVLAKMDDLDWEEKKKNGVSWTLETVKKLLTK